MEVAENLAKSRHGLIKLRIMKKVLVLLATVAFVACFTSCNKTCTCKGYINGVVITTDDVEVEAGEKCADMTELITNDNGVTGFECK